METTRLLPVGISASVAIFVIGVSMATPTKLVPLVGWSLTVLAVIISATLLVRHWWYVRHSHAFTPESGMIRRVSWKEFGQWSDSRRVWLRKNHPETYDALQNETSDRMGPPGRPNDKWKG